MTPLETFLQANKLKPGAVAREAGISRQQLYRIRTGIAADPSIFTAMRIRDACGRLLLRYVRLAEVFEVE
jgi:DNA-binding phage protein